jgi:hypothetical protein
MVVTVLLAATVNVIEKNSSRLHTIKIVTMENSKRWLTANMVLMETETGQ